MIITILKNGKYSHPLATDWTFPSFSAKSPPTPKSSLKAGTHRGCAVPNSDPGLSRTSHRVRVSTVHRPKGLSCSPTFFPSAQRQHRGLPAPPLLQVWPLRSEVRLLLFWNTLWFPYIGFWLFLSEAVPKVESYDSEEALIQKNVLNFFLSLDNIFFWETQVLSSKSTFQIIFPITFLFGF